MKKLLPLLLVFIATNCLASSYLDTLTLVFKTCATKAEFIKKCNVKFSNCDVKSSPYDFLSRDLDFNYHHFVWRMDMECKEKSKDGNGYNIHLNEFHIFLVTNSEDSIILGVIQELKNSSPSDIEIKESAIFCLNEHQINLYLKQHKDLYKVKQTHTEFVKQLTDLIVYGFGCGWGGDAFAPEAIQMIEYVKENSYKELSNWLKNINPELQAYAIEGLTMLSNKGVKIKKNDQAIMQHLIKRNSEVYYCSGCSYGETTNIRHILNLIERHEKRYIYKTTSKN